MPRRARAYDAGPDAAERLAGVPPYAETLEYVRRVQANAGYRAAGAGTARAFALSASPSVHGIL